MQRRFSLCEHAFGLAACIVALLAASACRAESSFDVNLNTAPLAALAGHTFSLDFQLNDGSPAGGDGNNTVTLSSFGFGGGSATPGTVALVGGASGSLGSGVTITDSGFLNDFTQDFTPGSQLSFHVHLTDNVGAGESVSSGGVPDQFSFGILDNGAEISSDVSGALLTANILGTGSPSLQTFPSDSQHGSIQPTIPGAVPEPGTWAMWVLGMVGFTLSRGRRR
jgi:hypothetical protein